MSNPRNRVLSTRHSPLVALSLNGTGTKFNMASDRVACTGRSKLLINQLERNKTTAAIVKHFDGLFNDSVRDRLIRQT